MKRSDFFLSTSKLAGIIFLSPLISFSFKKEESNSFHRFFPVTINTAPRQLDVAKRIPMGLSAFPVTHEPATIIFSQLPDNEIDFYFRLTAAIDFREEKLFELSLPATGEIVGTLDVKYAHPFQPFQLKIEGKWMPYIKQQGISIRMIHGQHDAWFLCSKDQPLDIPGLFPQIFYGHSNDHEEALLGNLYSLNSLSPFGWMEGSVMDGLHSLFVKGDQRAGNFLKQHLSLYLSDTKGLTYENPTTEPIDGRFNSIEDFLPVAAIVHIYPEHLAVTKAVAYWSALETGEGFIESKGVISTEGCYTLAYPMMAVACKRNDRTLAELSISHLRLRIRYLSNEGVICQQANASVKKMFANWGRGVAWYLLGMIKTLIQLKENNFSDLQGVEEVRLEFKNTLLKVITYQNKQGLWHCFIDQPQLQIDTSATAGIASAIALACHERIIDKRFLKNAMLAYREILSYTTPDGFITHVSQINRGGEALQRSDYRVISQFAMGLTAQLKAALDS